MLIKVNYFVIKQQQGASSSTATTTTHLTQSMKRLTIALVVEIFRALAQTDRRDKNKHTDTHK